MALQDSFKEIVSSETFRRLGSVVGGYLVADQLIGRATAWLDSQIGDFNLPSELDGIAGGLLFYAYGEQVFSEDTANMMAIGSLVNTAEEFTNREGIRNLLGTV